MLDNPVFLLSTAYFGPIQYFSKVNAGSIIIEKHENYAKQSYRNRCVIYGANGPLILNIPVKRGHGTKTTIKDILIDYDTHWPRLHKRGIMSAYKSAPFYEYYIDDILPFFEKKYNFLFDFNLLGTEVICELLQIDFKPGFTDEYLHAPVNLADYRHAIHPKKRMQKPDIFFVDIKYNQVFIEKFGFISNLSILDLLFNEGPNAPIILKNSYKSL